MPADRLMSEADYLSFEDAADTKHEFVDGYVYDWPGYDIGPNGLSGATRRHNRLQVNVLATLAPLAQAAGCEAFGSDMRLRVRLQLHGQQTTRYYYPDAMVICDLQVRPHEGDDEMHVTRPCLIVEILSRSSSRIDRGEKLEVYRGLTSLQTYLIVHQDFPNVERHWRSPDGTWRTDVITQGSVHLVCPDADLSLASIYG